MSGEAKSKQLVVVAGALGFQGSSAIKYLLKDGKFKLRGTTRDPTSEKAKALASQRVEVVKADYHNKSHLVAAFKGAYAVFAVTDFWTTSNLALPDFSEEPQLGNNIVDAAAEAKVQVLIYSSLEDIKTITNGKIPLPLFSGKAGVLQRAFKSSIPTVAGFHAGWYTTDLVRYLPATVAEDGAVEFHIGHLRPDACVPWIDIDDTGIYIVHMLNNIDKYKGKILRSGHYGTLQDFVNAFTKVTGKKARAVTKSRDEFLKLTHPQLVKATDAFNTVGYYGGQKIDELPGTASIEGWLWRSGFTGPQPAAAKK